MNDVFKNVNNGLLKLSIIIIFKLNISKKNKNGIMFDNIISYQTK